MAKKKTSTTKGNSIGDEKTALIGMKTGVYSALIIAAGTVLTAWINKSPSETQGHPIVHNVAKPVVDQLEIEVLQKSNFLQTKYVDKYDVDGKKYSHKIAHMDCAGFTLNIRNPNDRPIKIMAVKFYVEDVSRTHYSTQSEEQPVCCEKRPNEQYITLGDPKEGVAYAVSNSELILDSGQTRTLLYRFSSKAVELGTIVRVFGQFEFATSSGSFTSEQLEVEIHTDSDEVQYKAEEQLSNVAN